MANKNKSSDSWIRVPVGGVPQYPSAFTSIRDALRDLAEDVQKLSVQTTTTTENAVTNVTNIVNAVAPTSGTVTSVGLSLPNILTVSGSPVTTSGTLSATLANQNVNTVFAGPAYVQPNISVTVGSGSIINYVDIVGSPNAGTYTFTLGNTGSAYTLTLTDASNNTIGTPYSGASLPASYTAGGLTIHLSYAIPSPILNFGGSQSLTVTIVGANLPATPTFRALVATDIPNLSGTYLPLVGGTLTGQLVVNTTATSVQYPINVTTTLAGSAAVNVTNTSADASANVRVILNNDASNNAGLQLRSSAHATEANDAILYSGSGSINLYTGGNPRVKITSGGQVRIGPQSDSFASSSAALEISTPNGTATSTILRAFGTVQPSYSSWVARGTAASPTASQTDDTLVAISGRGYGDTGFAAGSRAVIYGRAAENWTDSAQGTYWRFDTTSAGATSPTEKMRLSAIGHLGINVTAPLAKLHVAGTGNVLDSTTYSGLDQIIVNSDGGGTNPAAIRLITSNSVGLSEGTTGVLVFLGTRGTNAAPLATTTDDRLGRVIFQGHTGTGRYVSASLVAVQEAPLTNSRVPAYLSFLTASTTQDQTERMRLTSVGYLGIGTTPTTILDISENVNSSAAVRITNPNTGASSDSRFILTNDASVSSGFILRGSNHSVTAERSDAVFYVTGANNMFWYTNSVSRMSLSSAGDLTVNNNVIASNFYSYRTNNTSNIEATYWYPIATVDIRTQFDGTAAVLRISPTGSSGGVYAGFLDVYFRIKQQNALGSSAIIQLHVPSASQVAASGSLPTLTATDVAFVLTQNDGTATAGTLYVRNNSSFERLSVTVLNRMDSASGSTSYSYAAGAGVSALPTGLSQTFGVDVLHTRANRVGIRTTNPQTALHIDIDTQTAALSTSLYNNTDAILLTRNSGTGVRLVSATSDATNTANYPAIVMLTAKGTLDAATVVASGDYLGRIVAQGVGTTGRADSSNIRFAVDGTVSGNNIPGRIELLTTDSGGTTRERLRLTAIGEAVLGYGEATGTVLGGTLRAPDRTGTDVAGTNLTISAGNGTGTGGSGAVIFTTAPTSTTSSTANTRTERMRIMPNGRVGIGVTNPTSTLTVKNGSGLGFLGIEVEDYTQTTGVYIQSVSGGSYRGISANSSYYNNSLYRSDDTVGSLVNLHGGLIRFYTNSGLTANTDYTPTERMRITDTGLVGINTSTPSSLFTVKTRTGAGRLGIEVEDDTGITGVYIQSVSGGDYRGISANTTYYDSNLYRSDTTVGSLVNLHGGLIRFYTNSGLTQNTDYTPTERMRITDTGNVGIGNTSPNATLAIGTDIGTFNGISIGGAADRDIRIGQSSTNRLIVAWRYNATPGSAYALLETQSGNNAIIMQSNGGNVGIGVYPSARLDVRQTSINAATEEQLLLGILTMNPASNSVGPSAAVIGRIIVNGGASNFSARQSGALFSASHTGTGTASQIDGITVAAFSKSTAGTVSALAAIRTESPSISTGTVTTAFGLRLSANKVAGVTTGYGVYQTGATDLNYFEGNVGIGLTSPAQKLDVGGAIAISGTTVIDSTRRVRASIFAGFDIDNNNNVTQWYKLGRLAGYGTTVTFTVTAINGYNDGNDGGIHTAVFKQGNADNELGGFQWTITSRSSANSSTFRWIRISDGNYDLYYVASPYTRGELLITDGLGFTEQFAATTDPTGTTEIQKLFKTFDPVNFQGGLTTTTISGTTITGTSYTVGATTVIDASRNLTNIGTIASGAITSTGNGGFFDLVGTDHAYIEFYPRGTGAGRKAYFGFGGASTTNVSLINEDTGTLTLQTTNNNINLTTGTGNVLIGVSNNANGGVLQLKSGITFPATRVAATDVNTLDDYEEGTFTPTLTSTGATFTYTAQTGRYTIVGNQVLVYARIALSALSGGTAANAVTLTGLPAAALSQNTTNLQPGGVVIWSTSTTNLISIPAKILPNTQTVTLYKVTAAGTTAMTALTYGDLAATTVLELTISYYVA